MPSSQPCSSNENKTDMPCKTDKDGNAFSDFVLTQSFIARFSSLNAVHRENTFDR